MNRKEIYLIKIKYQKWIAKRNSILKRDNWTCSLCRSNNDLHIHHKFYISGNEPWDYKNSVLVTLCSICHKHIHETKKIKTKFKNKFPKKKGLYP